MDIEKISKVYDRLLEIKLKISLGSKEVLIPNPGYINEKIWECHSYIEEVEKFIIEISKELSILQQGANNTQAEYDMKKERLLLTDEIGKLPSIKDREARANNLLREELNLINSYKNDISDLNNLLKVSNLKIKNLNRANGDIKILLRVYESQLKMSGSPGTDKVTKGLLEELSKSTMGEDCFKDAEISEEKSNIVDPSEKLNVEEITGISQNSIDPVADFQEDITEDSTENGAWEFLEEDTVPDFVKPEEEKSEEVLPDFLKSEDIPVKVEEDKNAVNLDAVLTESTQDKKEVEPDTVTKNNKESTPQKSASEVISGLDLDDFLDSIK